MKIKILNKNGSAKYLYQRVEYLEVIYRTLTPSGQENVRNYIDLNYFPNVDTKIEMTYSSPSYPAVITGTAGPHSPNAFKIYSTTVGLRKFVANFGSQIKTTSEYINPDTTYKVGLSKNGFYLNDTRIESFDDVSTISSEEPLLIGGQIIPGAYADYDLKVYRYKIYEEDDLLKDYVPVKRLIDNTYGLYDLINDNFIEPSGEGTVLGYNEQEVYYEPYDDNFKEYVVDEGAVITENFNETLDSANITISHQTDKIDIEPFDEVVLTTDFKTYYFCVDNYVCTMENIDPVIYSYQINLFSQTKLLEGIVLPNVSITPRKISQKRTIYNVLNNYLNEYGPKVREASTTRKIFTFAFRFNVPNTGIFTNKEAHNEELKDFGFDDYSMSIRSILNPNADIISLSANFNSISSGIVIFNGSLSNFDTEDEIVLTLRATKSEKVSFKPKWKFANRVYDKFSNFCPELQWNAPTLREVFNDLMMINDCIPVLKNNVIDFLDLTETTGNISNTWNYIQESQDSSNYASEIRMNMQNVLQTKADNISNTINTREYLTFTTDDNVLTDENLYLKTRFPILRIKHLWVNFFGSSKIGAEALTIQNKSVLIRADLCNLRTINDTSGKYFSLVKESKEYQTLRILKALSMIGINHTVKIEEAEKYQNLCVYYNRGSNIISGFSKNNKKNIIYGTGLTLSAILGLAYYSTAMVRNIDPSYPEYYKFLAYFNWKSGDNQFSSPLFEIEYESTSDSVFSASKDDYPNNERVIVDNQTNSWVDAETQGNLEYQKANRIGNKALMINQRTTNPTNRIKIQQIYDDDYIVYQTQYQCYTDHIEVNAQATKNYVLRDYFTGINSKIRTWVNAQDEAFIRHDLKKIYCEISERKKKETTLSVSSTGSIFYESFLYNIEYFSFFTHGVFENLNIKYCSFNIGNSIYLSEVYSRIIGNSIVLTTGFNDNWIFDKHFNTDETSDESEIKNTDIKTPTTFLATDGELGTNYFLTQPEVEKSYTEDYGGVPLMPIYFTNQDGEMQGVSLTFANEMSINDNGTRPASDLNITIFDTREDAANYYYNSINKPLASSRTLFGEMLTTKFNLLKDNKEIPKYSIQIEYYTDSKEDFYFTKKFIELQNFVREEWIMGDLFTIKVGDSERTAVLVEGSIEPTFYENSAKLTLDIEETGNYYFIYYDDELILRTTKKEFYINLLRSRNPNTYVKNSNNEWIKVGNINEYDN